jgi:phage gp29-like protein
MVEWADKAQSKLILGGTLTSQADGASSTNALGNVHNEVRHDILKSDARQIAATLTRDLIYPLIALNKGGIDSLRRCPRLVFDVSEAEDISALAEALPKLSPLFKIPVSWARDKLHIPAPEGDEEVLGAPAPTKNDAIAPGVKTPAESGAGADATKKPIAQLIAALSALSANVDVPDPLAGHLQKLSDNATSANQQMIATIQAMVAAAPNLDALQSSLLQAYNHLDTEALTRIMAAGFALAELQGMADVLDGQ